MNYIQPYKLFEEFVDISDYKKWVGHFNNEFYKSMESIFKQYPDHDKNYNRIYFDLKVDPSKFEDRIPQEIKDYMGWYGYPILDWSKGICQDKDGRPIKIGRLFQKINRPDLLKSYNDSRNNLLKNIDNLQIVISRHPYDIIGMSTGRGWSTCLDVKDTRYGGKHLYGLTRLLKEGCLVAYLIRVGDRDIKNPISRVIIHNYGSNESPRFSVDHHIYGTHIEEIIEFLNNWVLNLKK